MTHPKPKVGAEFFGVITRWRDTLPPQRVQCIVTYVGTKYFKAKYRSGGCDCAAEYSIGTNRPTSEHRAWPALYPSEQAYEDELQSRMLRARLMRIFSTRDCEAVPLDQLRQIATILNVPLTPIE